jgi:DNA invertase Pin-like site-specific DNA recombinase
MEKTKRCGIYTRCSTDEQSTDGQVAALKEFAAARGWVVQEVYEDRGVSGAKRRRPGLDAMWADCRKRKIDICLVWALDRLARSLKQLIEALDEFGRLGVDFVCLKQDIDSTNAASRLLFHIVGAVAEFERDLVRSRTVAGMEAARRKGKHIGRPPLRKFIDTELNEIRTARRKDRASVRRLSIRFGTTQWMIRKILDEKNVAIKTDPFLDRQNQLGKAL